jgi:hypothetical protein
LRTASTRIRQLEQSSTAFDYSEKDGKRAAHYVYLSPNDVLKIASALLLVAVRNGETVGAGKDIRVGLLQRYANQIMGVPVAKITTFLDVLAQVGVVNLGDDGGDSKVILNDADFFEALIQYLNEENLLEPSKRHDISLKGFVIMSLMAKHMAKFAKDQQTGMTIVNLGEIRKAEMTISGKEPFRMDEFVEVVKLGYASQPTIKSSDAVFTSIKQEEFMRAYRFQRVVMALNVVNEQKRKGGK